MESVEIGMLYQEISNRCHAAAASSKGTLSELTDYILQHEKRLNCPAFIELLILPIEAVMRIDSEAMEAYSKIVYRIMRETDLQNGDHYLSFQTSVTLQLLEFWAEQRGWPA